MRVPILFTLFLPFCLAAQSVSFSEVPDTPFTGVAASSVAFADVDTDGDLDVLIAGVDSNYQVSSVLYLQESGTYLVDSDNSFEGASGGSVAFADVDTDGDPDLLINGINQELDPIIRLYENTGGIFSEVLNTPFIPLKVGSAAFADIDNDGDPDLLTTGRTVLGEYMARLYTNQNGQFTEDTQSAFIGVTESDIAFADVDNDGDIDVAICGNNSQQIAITTLYLNESGVFTAIDVNPFDGVDYGDIEFADVEGDGDLDMLLSGRNNQFEQIAKLYANSNGIFSEVSNTPFVGVSFSATAFADVNGDNRPDVIITGLDPNQANNTSLYLNSNGSFTFQPDQPFVQVSGGDVVFSDFDVDGDADVLITGYFGPGDNIRKSRLYRNERTLTSVSEENGWSPTDLDIWPNPLDGDMLNLRMSTDPNETIRLQLLTIGGVLLWDEQKTAEAGHSAIQLNLAAIPSGVYLLKLQTAKGQVTRRIIRYK